MQSDSPHETPMSGAAPKPTLGGLYVHFPYCSSICPYCDFAVLKGGPADQTSYIDLLLQEIERAPKPGFSFETLHFGGGTPSLVPPRDLERVLSALDHSFDLEPRCSATLEVNPEDATAENLDSWQRLGFTRLSFGVQSFDPQRLRLLGRRHTREEAFAAHHRARQAGFEDLSIDLIYGLPSQTPVDWRADLDAALEISPDHISCYQLTIHEGTPFERLRAVGKFQELAEDPQADLFQLVHTHLPAAGYRAYEISNFARSPEHRSAHNQKYWQHEPYLGLGLASHSFDGVKRWWNLRSLTTYRERLAKRLSVVEDQELLSPPDRALEMLLLGLRTDRGVALDQMEAVLGTDFGERNKAWISTCLSRGLLERDGTRIAATAAGWAVADQLAAGFEIAPTTPIERRP